MKKTLEDICTMVDGLPGNYMVFEVSAAGMRTLHHTCEIAALTGLSDEQAKRIASPYDIVLEEDREMIRSSLAEFMKADARKEEDLLFRMTHQTKGFIWVHMLVKKYAVVEGRMICLASLVDVTKETMISYALMDASDRYICVIEKSTKRILYGNDKFYDLIGSSAAQVAGRHCYEHLCKVLDMKFNDNCLCYSSINADPPIESYNPETKMYLTITGREVVWGEYDAYVFYMTDITEKKQREAELEDSQKRFEVALENSDLMVWEYDIVNSRCIASQKALSDYSIPLIIENYPESLYEMGHTPPETIAQIKEVKQRLLNGETGFSVERRTVDDTGKSQWQKVEYTLECDADGKPLRAIVCGLDITKQKELEAKYEEQIEYRNKLAQNAMFSIRLDFNDNAIEDYTSTDERLSAIVEEADGADDFLRRFFKTSVFDPKSDLTQVKLTRDALEETYLLGQSQHHTVYRCSLLNLDLDLNMSRYKNPTNNHLEAFFVILNVTTRVLMQNAFHRVATTNYDFVAVVDPQTGKMMFLAHAEGAPLPSHQEEGILSDYDALVMDFANSHREFYYAEEDYRAASEGMRLPAIVEKLKEMPLYEFSCKARAANGDVQIYRLSFSYSDANKDEIVFTRANITPVVLEEQRNQQLLEQALNDARMANQAKTDFLSRMSHDMRTPMNGIIGMTHLTRDIPDLPAEAQGNLGAIADSSAYLLQLINDTLDMSKIESRRLELDVEAVDAGEMIQYVLATIRPLADAKKIQLDFASINAELEYVNADRIRLQQIFLNILSNAVKFTPQGGHIRWEIETLERENDIAHCRLSVEDDGCGMSQEYLEHIFDPFSQEKTRIVSGQEGTGLGMAIVKNLVDLMHGKIEVESHLGAGTKVTVYLDFERVYDIVREKEPVHRDDGQLKGRRVLLAEDHPLNATIARRLLEKKELLVEHAENGALAVKMFSDAKDGYYDAVLMDIRMPEMDGLEAARKIRTLKRADAKTTPIIAMTANAYQEDVQAALDAGMNAHLAKPIEPVLLYQTLEKYLTRSAGN